MLQRYIMSLMIKQLSTRSQVRKILIEKIMRGVLLPGERINETALAKELGVSQTPIREALLGLEGQGYILSQARRGFFVTELSSKKVREIYPVLAQLEAAALTSITSIPEDVFKQLEQINKKFAVSRGEKSIELDNEWHQLLLSQCHNDYLMTCIARVREDAHRYENLFFRDGGNISNSSSQHEAILSLLKQGKTAAACDALTHNNIHGIEVMCEWLDGKSDN